MGNVLCEFVLFRFFAVLWTKYSGTLGSLGCLLFGARTNRLLAVQERNGSMEKTKTTIIIRLNDSAKWPIL